MADDIATYSFLPWLRQGIATSIDSPDTLGAPSNIDERASIDVSASVNESAPISQTVDLIGPGDITGINPRAIAKTEPRQSVMDYEPNYLPYVEFYYEDFAWCYTPASARGDHRLRPWVFLATLADDEYQRRPAVKNSLPSIVINDTIKTLPNPEHIWAWAHVHVGRDVTENDTLTGSLEELAALVRTNPDRASCRLMSPRKLRPNTRYTGFVIPAFETGRLAGLSQRTDNIDALAPSWGSGQTEFPVYYEWSFGTGSRGDFEYLVSLLESRTIDSGVGLRDMDIQEPDFGLDGVSEPKMLGLEGALKAPSTESRPLDWPPQSAADFADELKQLVNLQADALEKDQEAAAANPIVGPPLYGRWHAKADRLLSADDGWVHELNEDPRLRAASGMGTGVVQKNQEDYMQRAWRQLGEILEANKKIRRLQLALVTNFSAYSKKLIPMSDAALVASTRQLLNRVTVVSKTVGKTIADSHLPVASMQATFRKITRPRGAVLRKANNAAMLSATRFISALNAGSATAAPAKTTPKGQLSFNQAALGAGPSPAPRSFRNVRRRRFGRLSRVTTPNSVTAANSLVDTKLTVDHVSAVPPRDNFVITKPGTALADDAAAGVLDSSTAVKFRNALKDLHKRFETGLAKPAARPPTSLSSLRGSLTKALNPSVTFPKRLNALVPTAPPRQPQNPTETISPIMAHPVFPDPMYAALRDIDSEFLVPNLGLIPQNTIGLLETNRRFIEAYMVGVNHEFSRELLWREFLTDQQGSYFRQFWDVSDAVSKGDALSDEDLEESLRDIKPIHAWPSGGSLGLNENRELPTGGEGGAARLVLVIRGDLLRKYPTAVVFAQKARWEADETGQEVRVLDERSPETNIMEPLFKAEIEPDIKFLGFNLTATDAKGVPHPRVNQPGWFFVLQERPGEPRFGLNMDGDSSGGELAWTDLGNQPPEFLDLDIRPNNSAMTPLVASKWNSNAADMAHLLYQTPAMVAFHAADMLRNSD